MPIFCKFAANSQLFNKNLRKSGAVIPLLRPIHPRFGRLLACGLLLLLLAPLLTAGESEAERKREQVEKRLDGLEPATITTLQIEQARLALAGARLRLEGAQLDRVGAEGVINQLKEGVKALELEVVSIRSRTAVEGEAATALDEVRQRLEKHRQELTAEQQRLASLVTLEEEQRLALLMAERWYKGLSGLYQRYQERSRREELADVEARLVAREQKLNEEVQRLRDKLAQVPEGSADERERLLVELQDGEERARLTRITLRRHRVEGELERLTADARLPERLATVRELKLEVESTIRLLEQKTALIGEQRALNERRTSLQRSGGERVGRSVRKIDQRLAQLAESVTNETDQHRLLLVSLEQRLATLERAEFDQAKSGPLARHQLPHDPEVIEHLMTGLVDAPAVMVRYLAGLVALLWRGLEQIDAANLIALLSILSLSVWLLVRLRRLLSTPPSSPGHSVGYTVMLLAELIYRLLPGALVVVVVVVIAVATQLPDEAQRLLLLLGLLWLLLGLVRALAWAFLALPTGGEEGAGRKRLLYHLLRWIVLLGGGAASLLLIAHWSGLRPQLLELLDRLFLALLLLPVPVLSAIRVLVDRELVERFSGRSWLSAVRLILLSVPIALLSGAAVAVFGYLNLSREIFAAIGWFVAIAALLLFSLGLLRDLTNALKNFALRHSTLGLLWAQGVIDPARRLLNLLLILAALLLLFDRYGWRIDSDEGSLIHALLTFPLVQFGETVVAVEGLLLAIVVVAVLIWFGRWVRELTYRWIYLSITDLGIRRSLSVFTQYLVVAVAGVVAMQSLGIDLTAFAVFAGALGVGLGLGLQSVANNFISGLLLLAERPLRTGDLVAIGGQEGEVTGFGIRSLTIRTWDHQEMIIPNAQVFSNSFTNWTLSDSVMRTIVLIRIGYDTDLDRVRRVLDEVVKSHPAVLIEPHHEIWLWEFTESAIVFRVNYYTDLQKFNRLEVRSQIMFEIWRQLAANGIPVPYPRQELHLKSWPEVDPAVETEGVVAGEGRDSS